MRSIKFRLCSAARYAPVSLLVFALLMAVLPVWSYEPPAQRPERPDPTGEYVRVGGSRGEVTYGQCDDPHEPSDTWEHATPISYGTQLADPDICPEDDVDYYSFDGRAGQWIVADIDANDIGSSLDSWLVLYDTDGVKLLFQNDDWGGTSDSHIEYILPANGTYYLAVEDYEGRGGLDYFYTIYLSMKGCDAYEPNHSWHEAVPISYSAALTALDICPAGDIDYFSFAGSAHGTSVVDIDAYNIGSSLDSVIYLYDTDGVTQLAYNDDWSWPNVDSRIEYTLPADGTYYLLVMDYAHPSYGGDDFFYQISLSLECSAAHEPNDTWEDATPISYGTRLADPDICPADDLDYYSFVGKAGDDIAVDIDAWDIGSDLDSVLYLYDTNGVTELAHNGDWGGSYDSHIDYHLPVDGTYYLKVQDQAHNGGPNCYYTISLNRATVFLPLVTKNYVP